MKSNIIWPACITAASLLAACGSDRSSNYSRYDATQDRDLYASSPDTYRNGDTYQRERWSTANGWNTNADRTAGNISGNDRSYPYEQSMAYRWSDRDRVYMQERDDSRRMASDWNRRDRDDWRRDTSYYPGTDQSHNRAYQSDQYSSSNRVYDRDFDHRKHGKMACDYDEKTPDINLSYSSDSDNWIKRGNDTQQQARAEARTTSDYYASDSFTDPQRNYSDTNRRMAASDGYAGNSNSTWANNNNNNNTGNSYRGSSNSSSANSTYQNRSQSSNPSANSAWGNSGNSASSNQSSSNWDSRLGGSGTQSGMNQSNSNWNNSNSDTRLRSDTQLQTGTSDATNRNTNDLNQRSTSSPPAVAGSSSSGPDMSSQAASSQNTTAQPGAKSGTNAMQPSGISTSTTATNSTPADLSNVTPDARILSFLQMKDQEEIEIGRMAQMNGKSAEVREFGQRLVKDHTDNASKVRSTAASANVTLLDKDQLMKLENDHKMSHKDNSSASTREMDEEENVGASPDEPTAKSPATTSTTPSAQASPRTDIRGMKAKDHVEALRGLTGVEFDRVFATKMVEGHQKVIKKVEKARSEVQNAEVRSLLDETLPTLREHLKKAESIRDDVNKTSTTTTTPESKRE